MGTVKQKGRVMKKIIAIVLILLMLAGCAKTETVKEPKAVSRFMIVESNGSWRVVVDSETRVLYAVSSGVYNHGNFTVLVDAEGKPLLWKGEFE